MHLRTLLVGILGVALILWGYQAYLTSPDYDVRQIGLTGVLKRKADVFAANPDGLYRSTLTTKQWVRLTTPPEMPLGGTFASEPEESSLVFYLANHNGSSTPANGPLKYGIYLSKDDGATWSRVSDESDYGGLVLLPNGSLFTVLNPLGMGKPSRVARSTDQGKTWRDITNNAFGMICGIFRDPDHPGQVCLTTNAIRNYVGQAPDENYDWKFTREWEWHPAHPSPDSFFKPYYSTTSTLYMFSATLANYFQHEFGNRTQLPAFDAIPLGDRFEFRRGERVVVPFQVVFREDLASDLAEWKRQATKGKPWPKPTPTTVTFVDQANPDEADLWGIRIERAGEQIVREPAHTGSISVPEDAAEEARLARLKGPGGAKGISLAAGSPYDRSIDLGKLADFSKPGDYRVQLFYSSGRVPDDTKGEWGGSFTSPVFRVLIR